MKITYSKSFLKKVGEKLRTSRSLTSKDDEHCFNEFRSGHIDILTYYIDYCASIIDSEFFKQDEIFLGARLKKRETIINKLQTRFQQMSLYRMHDIAGIRLIFPDVKSLKRFKEKLLSNEETDKKYINTSGNKYDYITKSKERTGYRGFHIVFQETEGDIKANIEIQLRTEVQHAWATTVEMWDSEFKDNAKFGLAQEKTIEFFYLLSQFLARFVEDINIRNIDLSHKDLFHKLSSFEKELQILKKLKTISVIESNKGARTKSEPSILIKRNLDNNKKNIEIIRYRTKTLKDAISRYSKEEQENDGKSDIVLILSKNMKRTYNNYFNDLSLFLKFYDKAIEKFKELFPVYYFIHK